MSVGSPLGDLAFAWERLRPGDAQTRAAIASALGLTLDISSTSAPLPSTPTIAPPSSITPPPSPTPASPQPTPTNDRHDLSLESTYVPAEAEVETGLGNVGMDLSSPLKAVSKELLLNPKWVRGIFSSRLSATVDGRELDIAACIRHEVHGSPYRRVPWRRVTTMSAGVRCYIDTGAPFETLMEDRQQVIRGLRSLAGFERVSVSSFETVPDAPINAPSEDADLAAPDSPVLILTDFGHYSLPGRSCASLDEWQAYIEREKIRGTPRIVALTPLDAKDWPQALRSQIEILAWDARTAARTARRHDS